MDSVKPVVILSTADYDATLWTNKQHIASRLAATHQVIYINSMGLRRPRINLADLGRIFRKLVGAATKRGQRPSGGGDMRIIDPKVVPLHGSAIVRKLNVVLTSRLRRSLPDQYDLWTFSPLTYGLEKGAGTVVYHSVDLLHAFEGVPSRALLRAEASLLRTAHGVVASSSVIADHLRSQGAREVLLWPNVADTTLFANRAEAQSVAGSSREGVVFAGNMSGAKVDFELLRSVAELGHTLYLAGPVAIDGSHGTASLKKLLLLPNVRHVGSLPQTDLAKLFSKCRVGLIPYLVNEYTQGVFPMKVHEYRAAGLHVVSTMLPSLEGMDMVGLKVGHRNDFPQNVTEAYALPPLALSDESLTAVSWESRLDQVRMLLSQGQRGLIDE